ncbi:MAG: OsmC family protein [Gemmatimonadetes bacterium]|nr:OsmC family protein [Gemmatimonadota bacterium]
MTEESRVRGDAIANPIDSRNATDEREWISATVGASGYRTDVQAGPHSFVADEPIALGGSGLGPTPYELLLGALSSCMAMTLRMYADRKKWPLQSVTVQLRTEKAHQKDCERCDTADVGPPRVARRIELAGPLSDEQRTRLLQIADRCPVKQTLERGLKVETVSR